MYYPRLQRLLRPCGLGPANGAAVNRLRKLQDSDTLIWEVYSGVSSPNEFGGIHAAKIMKELAKNAKFRPVCYIQTACNSVRLKWRDDSKEDMKAIKRVKELIDKAEALLERDICDVYGGSCDYCPVWQTRDANYGSACRSITVTAELFGKALGRCHSRD